MTLYAGEPARLTTSGKDWNGDPLTDANTTDAWIGIWTADKVVDLDHTALVWNQAEQEWEYIWNTAGHDPGSYTARLVLVGASDGLPSWEFQTVRLRRNPVPV